MIPDTANTPRPGGTRELRKVLEFYGALGFDRLPLTITRADALNLLHNEASICRRCDLAGNRTRVVFGDGSAEARIMFIGAGPRKEEDVSGQTFAAEEGRMLQSLISKLGLAECDIYFTNIMKCRMRANHDLTEEEIEACLPYLKEQIRIINPEAIVTMGHIAAHSLLGLSTPLMKLRGKLTHYLDIPLMPTLHPAYLIRNRKDKLLVWADMHTVLDKLGIKMP